jgi:methyl-accepting chemotaxis protein
MSASSGEVNRAIENITSISEENSEMLFPNPSMRKTAASASSAQVQEVTAEALTLAQMARALQEVVAQFRLSEA